MLSKWEVLKVVQDGAPDVFQTFVSVLRKSHDMAGGGQGHTSCHFLLVSWADVVPQCIACMSACKSTILPASDLSLRT